MPEKISSAKVLDAWAQIDRLVAKDPYLRFQLDAHRNWDDLKKRTWQAILYEEGGKVLARAKGSNRKEALIGIILEYQAKGRTE